MRHKRNENRRYDWNGEHSGSGEGSSQTYRSTSKIPKQKHRDRRDQELECLHKLVRDLELEVRNRHQKRNHDKSLEGSVSVGDNRREASHQSSSR